jgi:hypothetical protein
MSLSLDLPSGRESSRRRCLGFLTQVFISETTALRVTPSLSPMGSVDGFQRMVVRPFGDHGSRLINDSFECRRFGSQITYRSVSGHWPPGKNLRCRLKRYFCLLLQCDAFHTYCQRQLPHTDGTDKRGSSGECETLREEWTGEANHIELPPLDIHGRTIGRHAI